MSSLKKKPDFIQNLSDNGDLNISEKSFDDSDQSVQEPNVQEYPLNVGTKIEKTSPIIILTIVGIFFLGLTTMFFLATSIRFFWFRPVAVTGNSMLPTYTSDSLVYANTTRRPTVGDVVIFYNVPPEDQSTPSVDYYGANAYFRSMPIFGRYVKNTYSNGYELMIKRVVAQGGDEVELRAETINDVNFIFLYVNGKKIEEDIVMLNRDMLNDATYNYALELTNKYGVEATQGVSPMAPLLVEDNHFFVLGDNRDDSRDSRDFGAVNAVQFVGVIR